MSKPEIVLVHGAGAAQATIDAILAAVATVGD
jgi:hypothetical protein